METSLRARPDLLVTCSDACETEGAIAATAGLSDYGVRAAKAIPRQLPTVAETGFALVSLFGGIEAGRRACDLLGVKPIRHIAVDRDPDAVRVVSEVYPDVIHFKAVTGFTRDSLHKALAGATIAFVLLLAGLPCQGLSGANPYKERFL